MSEKTLGHKVEGSSPSESTIANAVKKQTNKTEK